MEKKLYELKIDEEFKTFCPQISDTEYKDLKENVLEDGIRDALVVWNGVIIDGHNRYKIAREHGIPFQIVEKEFESREDAKLWIGRNLFSRRNMDMLGKCLMALKMEPFLRAEAKKRQGKRNDLSGINIPQHVAESSEKGDVRDKMAEMAGVSHTQIDRVRRIFQSDHEDIKERVLDRDMSVREGYFKVVERDKGGSGESDKNTEENGYREKADLDSIDGSDEAETIAGIFDAGIGNESESGREKVGHLSLHQDYPASNESVTEIANGSEPDTQTYADYSVPIYEYMGMPGADPEMRMAAEQTYVRKEVRKLTEYFNDKFERIVTNLSEHSATDCFLEEIKNLLNSAYENANEILRINSHEEERSIVDVVFREVKQDEN